MYPYAKSEHRVPYAKSVIVGLSKYGASLLYSLGGVVFELHSRVSGVQLSYHEGEASHISSWLR